jgi:hypothetical protein
MKPQPLLFLGQKRKQLLLARMADSARRWRTSWIAQSTDTFEAQCEPPAAGGHTELVASVSTSCWALEISEERQAVLLLPHSTWLWAVQEAGVTSLDNPGTPDADSMAGKLEQEVATSLFTELCAVDRREALVVTRVASDTLAEWSRGCRAWTLQLRAPGAGRAFTLLVSAQRFEMLAPARAVLPPAQLASRRDAVGGNSLSLRAVVGELSMSVSELADVAIDDVLVLDQHLTDPVAVLAAQSRIPVAAGNLGRAGARRAIKISSIPVTKN